jgi:hypothetical protein
VNALRAGLALAAVITATGCGLLSQQHPSPMVVAGTNVPQLVERFDVIVVGTVVREAGQRNTARDAQDVSKEHPSAVVLAQQYQVLVGEVIKGAPGTEITVLHARARGTKTATKPDPEFVPLAVGAQYLLFLRPVEWDPSLFAMAPEPNRFKLTDTATVESAWRDAPQHFPPTDARAFLATVRAVASSRTTTKP